MWSWLSSMNAEARLSTMLGFASRAIAPVAACIFGCFPSRDFHYQVLVAPDDAVVESHHALSELFVSDRDQFGALARDEEERWNLLFEEFDFRELKDEAKFLKACGTIPGTPVEIRNASKELIATSAETGERKSSSFKSWLPNEPIEKLNLENEADESPIEADSLLDSPSPNRRDSERSTEIFQDQNVMTPTYTRDHGTPCFEASSVSPVALHTSLQHTQKSVRFDFSSHRSMFASEDLSSDRSSKQSDQSGSDTHGAIFPVSMGSSPYPTPLKLSDEMHTPGTIFPGYSHCRTDGKTARIRCQYVYSNPVKYHSHSKEVNSEISGLASLEELEANDDETLVSNPILAGGDVKNEVSFTSPLGPTLTEQGGSS